MVTANHTDLSDERAELGLAFRRVDLALHPANVALDGDDSRFTGKIQRGLLERSQITMVSDIRDAIV